MVQTKKMDESTFAEIIKEFNAVGELIRARQDEKQAVIDGFNSESKRFFFGKISERTLASSVRKTNKELQKLDDQIRETIEKTRNLAGQARRFASIQSPRIFKATLSGVKAESKKRTYKRRKPVKKKSAKKSFVKRKSKKKK